MARKVDRLTDLAVRSFSKPGRYADGAGLYLAVGKGGAKKWVFLFRWRDAGQTGTGRLREMGLGSATAVTLKQARAKARVVRTQIERGLDPIAEANAEAKPPPNFGEMADALISDLSPQWRNPKHQAQWKSTLGALDPKFRAKLTDQISTDDVLRVLKPIWAAKPETASRVRGRIERVLDAAKAKGHRAGENPARWRGHLDHLLPARQKLTRGHHPAMAYDEVPAFISALRAREGFAAMSLEFTILTAARTGEALGCAWPEVDLKAKVWTVPAERTKGGREHRIPLCERAVAILERAAEVKKSDYVFQGERINQPLSGMAMEMVLRRMKSPFTVHGFRSSFRDWAGETTSFPREVAEAALGHVVGNAVERAYRRGDALAKRRELMEAWGRFCEQGEAGNVVALAAGAAR